MPSRLIAHRILKEQHSTNATVVLRHHLLEESEMSAALIEELRSVVSKGSQPGKFIETGRLKPRFRQCIERYESDATDSGFVRYSQEAIALLKEKMERESFATGGYVVFAEYTHGEEKFSLIAILATRHNASFDDSLNLVATPSLDFEHLRHAARIRHSNISENSSGVVQFVSKAEGVSDYFREFLGCEPLEDTSIQGAHLLHALGIVTEEHNLDLDEVNQIAYSYWQRCQKERVDMTLSGLANLIAPNDPAPILERLLADEFRLAGQFRAPPRKVMLQFIKFAFNKAGMKLEFDKKLWADYIKVTGRTVQIKHAPQELIDQIKDELGIE